MKEEIVISVKGLTKKFSNEQVIKGYDMVVRKQSIYGFLGRNGAGKTTVFKLLTGLLKATSGEINVFGKNVKSDSTPVLKDIGLIIETPIFYEHLTGIENLRIHMDYLNRKVKDIDLTRTLELVGLHNIESKKVSAFSLGMRQRLAIARAIIHKPKLLILDEPLNGLDPIGIRDVRDLFKKLVEEQQMTILISSHNLYEIELIADTIGVIADGAVVNEHLLIDVKKKYPNKLEDYFFSLMKEENDHVSFN